MSSLVSLPQEMLLVVVEFIDEPSAVLNLMCCSRFFHQFALPNLYHHVKAVTPLNNVPVKILDVESSKSLTRLYNFTYRILAKPELASYVRIFEFDTLLNSSTPLARLLSRQGGIKGRLQYAARRAGSSVDDGRAWVDEIQLSQNGDALLALLLPHLPRLEHLEITLSPSYARCRRMLSSVVLEGDLHLPSTALGCLKRVVGRSGPLGRKDGIHWEEMALFLRIPSVMDFRGNLESVKHSPWFQGSFDDRDNEYVAKLLPEQTSNAKAISLTTRSSLPAHWSTLLSSFRALQSLSIKWGFEVPGKYRASIIFRYLGYVGRAIRVAAHSLEHISLEHQSNLNFEDFGEVFIDDESICSFTNFKKLKHLRLGMIFIFGPHLLSEPPDTDGKESPSPRLSVTEQPHLAHRLASLLPHNIETLRLVTMREQAGVPLLMNVADVMKKAGDQFPALKSICLEHPSTFVTLTAADELLGKHESSDPWEELDICARAAAIDLSREFQPVQFGVKHDC